MTATQYRRGKTNAIAGASHGLLPEILEHRYHFARQGAAKDEGMGGVGGREGNAGQATEVDSDAGFYGREGAISSMTAVNGEERNGVGVGIFDLEGRWVSSGKFAFLELKPDTRIQRA